VKVAVFGPEHRVGILDGENVIDIERAYAKLAREVQDHPLPYAAAAAATPAGLESFINMGDRAIESAKQALSICLEPATRLAHAASRSSARLAARNCALLSPIVA
jgi:hypothetical protein